MRLSRPLVASILLIAGGLTVCSASEVRGAPSGSKTREGLGAVTPLRTLAAALQPEAVRRDPGGTTFWLHGGVYEDVAVELGPPQCLIVVARDASAPDPLRYVNSV